MNLHLSLTLYTKINSKWIMDLNLKHKIGKLLQKGKHLGYNMKSMIHIRKIDKLDFIKIKNICCAQKSVKSKRQAEDWENTFADQIANKELVLRIYNKCIDTEQ